MAAGLGFKDFQTGEVLTAADVDGYLMQGIWVFASAAARDAAVTSPQEGNFAYLKDTNVTTYYTGSAWTNLDTTGMVNPMTTTGDTIYSSSGSTPARLGIGSTGQVLTVSGGVPSWATPSSGGGMTLLSTTTLSGNTTTISSISQSYKSLFILGINGYSSASCGVKLRLNGNSTGTDYRVEQVQVVGSAVSSGSGNFDDIGQVTNTNTWNTRTFFTLNITRYTETESKLIVTNFRSHADRAFWSQVLFNSTTAISSIGFELSGGQTWSGGTVYVYGVN